VDIFSLFLNKNVQGIVKTFNMCVKFLESRWPQIKMAEEETPEGQKIYNELREEFLDKFFNEDSENFEAAALEKT